MSQKQIRIFVVEDESIVAMDIMSSLRVLGYEVVGNAARGEDAIPGVCDLKPDLVLMDIILQGEMDGVQAAEAIHARLDVPVIFLTACADDATLQRAKVTEPFGYLIKPFEEWELRGHIEIALYKHRMEKRLRESEERYSLATQGANDGLWDWNLETGEIYLSPRWKSMLGYEDWQIGNTPEDWFKRLHPADKSQVEKLLTQHIMGRTGHFESEYRILDATGSYRWVLCRGLARRNAKGDATRIAGSQTDITDRKVYNPLTGLPNRILLSDRLERALKRVKRQPDSTFAVLAVDIDGLKMINDSLGYLVADQMLTQISRRIQGCLASQDTVAHFGDYDFVLLREEVKDAAEAIQVASRLHCELEQPFQVDGQTVYITASTGITLCTKEYTCPDELLRDATTAMQRAKASGKGRCEIYDRDMRSAVISRIKLEADLRKAFEKHEFRVHYQPIVCLESGNISGFEALVRWQRPSGLVYPEDFLALAEATDLILPLENWVLRETCDQVTKWQAMVPAEKPLTLNVNLCARHYVSSDLIATLKDILQRTGLATGSLHLEITESALMENSETISNVLSRIRDMNIQIHMDDFGTGFSSLSYLQRFPIDALKIDRSFVGDMGTNEESWKIVQAISSLAKSLDLKVIAEGVENMVQLRMLQSVGCEFGQGYYLSKPLDPRTVESVLSGRNQPSMAFRLPAVPRPFPFAARVS